MRRPALLLSSLSAWALFATLAWSAAKEPKHPTRGHAHNDYEHARPLLDALEQGFFSVEADIHLVDGKLLVAHDRAGVRPERTLEALYLEPLARRVKENGGQVYPGGRGFVLLVDIKTEAESTYAALDKVLAKYADMLTFVRDGFEEKRAVTIIVSGERPRATLASQKLRRAGYDGRIEDLDSKDSPHLMPLISDNWTLRFKWRGDGAFPEEERLRLQDIVERAQAKGRGVRFWATPDKPAVWNALYDAGVDLINTDDLKGLAEFLRSRAEERKPVK